MADVYRDELRQLEDKAAALQDYINREKAASAKVAPLRRTVRDLDVEGLWTKTDHEINQTLHAVFGQWRMVVKDHKVIGYRKHHRISRQAKESLDTLHRRTR